MVSRSVRLQEFFSVAIDNFMKLTHILFQEDTLIGKPHMIAM